MKSKTCDQLVYAKASVNPPSVHWSSTHPSLSKGSLEGWWAFCVCLWIPDNVTSCQMLYCEVDERYVFFWFFFLAFLCFFFSFFCFVFFMTSVTPPKQQKYFLSLRRDFWTFATNEFHQNLPYKMYVPTLTHNYNYNYIDSMCRLG